MKSCGPGWLPVASRHLRLVGAGRLVAVVPVGQDDRRRGHGRADGGHGVGVAQHPELVAHAVVVVGVGDGLVVGRVEGGGQPGGHGEPPDGGEVGPGGAQEVEAVALGLGQGLLVGQDVALLARLGQAERPDDAGRGAPGRVRHAIGVQARPRARRPGRRRSASCMKRSVATA